MKAAPVILPSVLQTRLGADTPTRFMAVGNTALLAEPLLGLIASRECPGHVLLQILELATQWAWAEKVILSGFHSPLEQQVLRSMLRRNGRAIKLLAHALDHYRVPQQEKAALASGHLLVLSASPSNLSRTTRAHSLTRNRLVLAMSGQHCIPYLSPTSPIWALTSADLTSGVRA